MMKRCLCLMLSVLLLLPAVSLASNAKVQTPGGRLNMRAEPDTKSGIEAQIPNKTVVTFIEHTDDEWSKIRYKGQEGYVKTIYLNLTRTAEGKTIYADASDAVFVRQKASDSSKIITALSWMSPLVILEVGDEWTKVSCTNADGETVEGYIRTARIIDQHQEPQQQPSVTMNEEGVMRSKQKLYAVPSTKAEVVATLPKGQVITVLSIDGDWCHIKADNIVSGYVGISSVALSGQAATDPVSPLANYTAVYYTCTIPSGEVPVYVEPTGDLTGNLRATLLVDPTQQVKVLLRGQTSHGQSWSRIVLNDTVYWTPSSNLKISTETQTMQYASPVPNFTAGIAFVAKGGATMYASASRLTEKLGTVPAGTELEGVLHSDCIYAEYKGQYGYVFYDQVILGFAEVRDPDKNWYYWQHIDDPVPTPGPSATPMPTEDESRYISASQARKAADEALKIAYSSFSAKNLRVVYERLASKYGNTGPVYEFAYYKNDKYVYTALVDALDGSVLRTADYTGFGNAASLTTPKPAPTTRPGEISYSDAKRIASDKLRATYGGYGDYSYTLNNEYFEQMPAYDGPVYRLNYYHDGEHDYTCIVSAKTGKVLYHTDVWDSANTEIDYSTPTPEPTYESTIDIGQDRAREIAESALARKYPDFTGASFSSTNCRFIEDATDFERPYYIFDYFINGHLAYEVIVHAWTGRVLYTMGGLPGEGNG